MKQSFTLNQCLRMLYGETSPGEEYLLNDIIANNHELKDQFAQMKAGYDALSTIKEGPSAETLSSVMSYVRKQPIRLGI